MSCTSAVIAALSVLSLITVQSFGAPTTYDQRQDGGLNFAAKLENIMIVVATPSKSGSNSIPEDDGLEAYLTLLDGRDKSSTNTETSGLPESNNREKTDRMQIQSTIDDVEDNDMTLLVNEEILKQEVAEKIGKKSLVFVPLRSTRSIWRQIENAMIGVSKRSERSLKKVVSWGLEQYPLAVAAAGDVDRNRNERIKRSSDHNELGSLQNRNFVGNCKPDKHSDGYVNC